MSVNRKITGAKGEPLLVQRLHSIAKQQMRRSGNRLGDMTEDQRTAVEGLLISTIEQIYSPIIARVRNLSEIGNEEKASVWISILD